MTKFLSLTKVQGAALLAAAALVAGVLAGGSSAAGSSQFTIQLLDNGPDPAQLTVVIGDSVTFTNGGSENHDVVMPNANYTAPLLHPGDSTTLQLKTAGKYAYTETGFSHTHHGTIIVNASSGSGTPLTLSAGAGLVVYGAHATLEGQSTMPPGTAVALYAHAGNRASNKCSKTAAAYAQAGWTPVGSPSAVGADGRFSFVVTPTITTMYRAVSTDGQTCSTAVQMQVRPIVTIHVSPARTKTGRSVAITSTVHPATATTSLVLAQGGDGGDVEVGHHPLQLRRPTRPDAPPCGHGGQECEGPLPHRGKPLGRRHRRRGAPGDRQALELETQETALSRRPAAARSL